MPCWSCEDERRMQDNRDVSVCPKRKVAESSRRRSDMVTCQHHPHHPIDYFSLTSRSDHIRRQLGDGHELPYK